MLKSKIEDNKECIFNRDSKCFALTKKECKNCSFFKSNKEYEIAKTVEVRRIKGR